MKTIFAVCFLAMVAVVLARPEEKYTDKYDNIDLDKVLASDRLFNAYVKCLLEEGKCTPDGNELKKVLPDALQTGCSKCTEPQEKGARKMINYMIKEKPEVWEKLCSKYDPESIYRTKYEKEYKEQSQ